MGIPLELNERVLRLRSVHLQMDDGRRNDLGGVLVLRLDERPDTGEAHNTDQNAESCADIAKALARNFSGSDAPLGREQPDAIREVPADGDHGDDVDGEHPGISELVLYFREGCAGIFRQADAHEALAQHMLEDVSEGDQACIALCDVHPVPGPRIVDNVRFAAQPDINAVESVIKDGQEDENPLENTNQGQGIEELDLRTIGSGTFECLEVREQVLQKKGANGNDAEQ